MLGSKRKFKRAVVALACFVSIGAIAQTTTLPTMEVTADAPTTDGGGFTCFSAACAGAVMNVQMMMFMERQNAELSPDEIPLDRQRVCNYLKGNQPAGCSVSNPPSVPGYDPSWIGNGCGDGSFGSVLANEMIDRPLDGYQGNLNRPLPNISFYNACQNHDYCYASGQVRGACDRNFRSSLGTVCATSNQTYRSSCDTLTDIYSEAVETFGQRAYNTAQGELACAAWAFDMKYNGCDK